MQAAPKLHYCTDLPIAYRHRKIKSIISALGIPVVEVPRETYADLREFNAIPSLPLLETSEGNFSSTNTIIRYLAAKSGNRLYGENLYERALIDQWLDLAVCDFDTLVVALNLYLQGKQIEIEKVVADAEKFLAHLNKHLKNRKFIVGENLTIADLATAAVVGPVLANLYGEEERRKYGILSTWYLNIVQLNKDIEPRELPKKIHKKFQKKQNKEEEKEKGQVKGKQEKQEDGEKKDKKKKQNKEKPNKTEEKPKQVKPEEDDLFGDDTKTADAAPKAKKPEPKQKKQKPAAKSIVVFNVKVYEQEQDLNALADRIKTQINMDGLVWNNEHELKPIAFGMNMLELGCVIEDSKVSIENDVFQKIYAWDTEVQSIDTVTFQKL